MISVNTGGLKENNRWYLVINYCEKLNMDLSILQEKHVNFSHLHDIREIWGGKVIISQGKTQTCSVLVLVMRAALPIE